MALWKMDERLVIRTMNLECCKNGKIKSSIYCCLNISGVTARENPHSSFTPDESFHHHPTAGKQPRRFRVGLIRVLRSFFICPPPLEKNSPAGYDYITVKYDYSQLFHTTKIASIYCREKKKRQHPEFFIWRLSDRVCK